MEYGSIERDIQVDAAPEVVFEVISRPEHMREWWPDDARFEPVAGAPGELVWRDAETGETTTVALAVVEVDPPKRFSFRWCYSDPDRSGNSLFVTFDLVPAGGGTRVRMTETGFREMGWEIAQLEAQYRDHETGWDHYLARLGTYVTRLVATS
ncbi:SRPBCC domain-containing protein [Micromonospora sp. C28SCA-DRY-2]|uniref:SRPBCC domain-containing protein n=1 Tax=Micromonospora sp. C28SCA-DRY-2 TaxID=3059522 RepID=UPI002676D363|nr:SRPBCC domain-containing protein [Micromonospora sp. C28SCA-DRY-2]MDO3705428.1 SRPBCC domain-containing protein [Micromonospora sp. C28SCA-DRY-2]